MAFSGLRSAMMLGFLVEEYIEDARTIWWYWHTANKQVSAKNVTPQKFLKFFNYVDIEYTEGVWKLRFTAQAKDKREIANEMSSIIGDVYIPFVGYVSLASMMYKDCDIIITATNVNNTEIGRLKPDETATFTLTVDKIYPLLNIEVVVNYTVTIPLLNIDYTATDNTTFDIQIDSGDYASVEKKWKAETLKTYIDNAEELRKELDKLSKQIDRLLEDWLEDQKPDKEILIQLEPALNNYKKLYESFIEAQEKVISMSKQMGLIPPNLGQLVIYRLVKGINDLPKREKLEKRLKQLESDIRTYISVFLNDLDKVKQEIAILDSEVKQLKNSIAIRLSQLGASYAKAQTEAERRNYLQQRDTLINDYIAKKNEITARHRQRIAELLNQCYTTKNKLDKAMAEYSYLSGINLRIGE